MGSDAVFKLRCSNGIQVKSYSPTVPFGRLVGDGIVDSAELELASIDSSTAVAVLLEHKIGGITNTLDAGKKDSPMVFFQSAVLYTTLTGKRRVRVSTIGLPTTKVAADVFRSADLGAVATVMTRQAVSDANISDDGLKSARFKAFDQCVTILANYRLHTNARTSSSGQLILPESLQLLPLFCLSLRKSRMFRHCLQTNSPSAKPSPTADERAYHIFYASMVSPNIALQCIHPNVFQVSDLRACDGEWIAPPVLENNKFVDEDAIATSKRPVCQLPKSTNPSMTCLDESGMYILDDRFALYLFVGKDVPQEKWSELISFEPNNDAINGNYHEVPVGALSIASTDAGSKVRSILRQLRMMNAPNPTLALIARPTYAPLISVFVGRGASALPLHTQFEGEMDSLLIDDPDSHEKSYVDFLCTIHRAIRDKNSNAE
jgi:protein transport protein SEC24